MPTAGTVGAPVGRLWEEARARRELIPLTAIIVIAAAARFSTLGLQSFDSGETITAARILHPDFGATFHAVATIERSGPLYYTLAWCWAHLFGTGEVALRSLSALLGTATVPVVYFAARELTSRRSALIAACLAALSPDLLWYSQEARSYPLFILLSAAALYFFARTLRRPSRGSMVGWATASALALATHYFAIFSIVPEAVWLIVASRGRRRAPLIATGSVAAVGVALLPLAIAQEGTGRGNGFTSIPVLERAASGLIKFMAGEGPSTSGEWVSMPTLSRWVGLVAIAACAAAVALIVVRGGHGERRAAAAFGGVGAVAFAAPVALALLGLDYMEPRNLIVSLVPLLVVAAVGLDLVIGLSGRRPAVRAASLAPGVSLVAAFVAMIVATAVVPRLERDDWRGISTLLAAHGPVGVILTQPPSAAKPLRYYFGHPLTTLGQADFPCGVRARTIVTLSRNQPEPVPRSGFRLVADAETAQHWRIASYRAPSQRRLDAQELRILDILKGNEAPRVDGAHPVEPRPLSGNLATGPMGRPPPATACRGPGVAVRLARS
jgi:hypothetical protein